MSPPLSRPQSDALDVPELRRPALAEVLGALGWTWIPGVRPFAGATPIVDRSEAIRLAVFATLILTALFYAPALAGGYMADDHFHLFALGELPEAFRRQWNLFSFIHSTEEVQVLRKWGILPWWTSDAMRVDFFRPIPSLTHALDFWLFGKNAAAAHLVSIGWYLVSVYLVYRVLSRFLEASSRTLLLAVAIFAFDDTHALNVQWLANRNDVVAAVFLLTGFLGYLRLREGKGRANAALVIFGFVCALLSKESSIVFPALVLAHAVILPDAPKTKLVARVRPLFALHVALAAVALAYLAFYFLSGHGPNTVYYLNPIKNPALWGAQFFRSGFFHAVILATGVPLHVLSSSPVYDHPFLAALCGGITLGFWALVWKLLRNDRPTRFFIVWMLVAQVIITTSFPDPRLLFLPSIGFAYVVARVMKEAWDRRGSWAPAKPLIAGLVALHFVFAPLLDQACVFVVNNFQHGYDDLRTSLRAAVDYEHLPESGTEVFFLNWHQREASALANLYLTRNLPCGTDVKPYLEHPGWSYTQKIDNGFAALKIHYYALSFLLGDVDVRAVSDKEIELTSKDGPYFPSLFEQLYLTSTKFEVGQTFEMPAFKARIIAIDDTGAVRKVRFTFPKPISSQSYRFMAWNGHRFVTVDLAGTGRVALRATR